MSNEQDEQDNNNEKNELGSSAQCSSLKRLVTDFNRFLNSQTICLFRRKPKNNGAFLLTIPILSLAADG